MAVAGRKPKPAGQAINRNKPVHDWSEVPNVPFVASVKLPRTRLEGKPWPALTKAWWADISSMPHCVLWSAGDWRFAVDTALLAAEYHDGNVRMATELRNRERVLGTTLDFRRDLRIRYVAVDDGPDAEVARLADYRDL